MPVDKLPFTVEDFNAIYSKVPRLCVEVLVTNAKNEVLLTKRSVEPCVGQWALPGGTVFINESLMDAVKRIAERELGITVTAAKQNGLIEYPSHYQHGLDTPVGIVHEIIAYSGEPNVNNEASELGWFASFPDPLHADQGEYLVSHGYMKA